MTSPHVPVVLFPDVEALCVNHLLDTLPSYWPDDVQVGTRKPSPMPAGGVIQVRRVGGLPLTEVSDDARMDFWIWHDTDEDAAGLTACVAAVMQLLRGNVEPAVHRIDTFAGPAHYDDPDSDQPRWLLSLSVAVKGTSLAPIGS